MGKIGIKCGFCGELLSTDYYHKRRGITGDTIVYCDNEECPVKPCSDATLPSKAFAEARLFGKIRTEK